jgi:hypothetical protein
MEKIMEKSRIEDIKKMLPLLTDVNTWEHGIIRELLQAVESPHYVAFSLNANHDSNGNPRRVYVILDETGDIAGAIDEGYNGRGKLDKKFPGIGSICNFKTTPAEYREVLAMAKKGIKVT